jgi:hypothetical protein
MQERHGADDDRSGVGESRNYVAEALGAFVPRSVARWAVTLDLSVAGESDGPVTVAVGDPVEFTVTIRNRLPLPVSVATPRLRLWTWAVDGEVEASDEPRYASDTPSELALSAGETRRVTRTWDGRLERTRGDRHRWVTPDPGRHELSAFVATDPPCASDAVELDLRR